MARYKHDCDICVPLGTHEEYDLYWCPPPPAGAGTGPHGSLIARWNSDGPCYASCPVNIVAQQLKESRAVVETQALRAAYVSSLCVVRHIRE